MARTKQTARVKGRARDVVRKNCTNVELSELAKRKEPSKKVIEQPSLRQFKSNQDESTTKGGTNNHVRHTDNKSKAPRGHEETLSKIQKVECDARQVYFEHLLDPDHPLNWRAQPAPGLENPGSLCYINTTVQLLYGMKCTRNLFSSGSFWQGLDLTTVHQFDTFGQKGGFIAVALHTLFQEMHLHNCRHSVESFKDVLVLHHSFRDFDNTRQQDANELLTKLLDTLSEALRTDNKCDPISEVFRSRAISYVRCQSCHRESYNRGDWSTSLEVAITGRSIMECISQHFRLEDVHDWKCGHCKLARPAFQGFRLEPRNILIISLKRFSVNGTKNNTRVDFPFDDLDMTKFTETDEQTDPSDNKFSLIAVIQHYGDSPCKGHYDVIMRTGDTTWHRFDDKHVELTNTSKLVTSDVYTIIYCRHDKLHELIF
jgi:ubiquitin C-terminal hydrolase